MLERKPLLVTSAAAALLAIGFASWPGDAEAQREIATGGAAQARAELARAQKQARAAQVRADKLSAEAANASEAAEKSTREAAALAARIQLAEAGIAASEARLALVTDMRRQLDARLASKQQPIVRLTAALQNMARRPLSLSALRPGSLKDTVYVQAVLETTIPEIRSRTVTLRSELARGKKLEAQSAQAVAQLRANERELRLKRQALTTLASQQRAASRKSGSIAMRENDRALALAEEARDLDDLVGELDNAGRLRRELAALPGPILRPAEPGASVVAAGMDDATPAAMSTNAPSDLRLPVEGRTLRGFGAVDAKGGASNGLSIAPRSGALVVAPAAGRVAFAGPYRGFGQIVIIEHDNGWTSLVTGLGETGAAVGDYVVSGSPLGNSPQGNGVITLELRRDGEPVNPLQYME